MRRLGLLFFVLAPLASACTETASDLVARGDELSFSQQYAAAAKSYEAAVLESEGIEPEAVTVRATALKKLGEVRHLFLADVQGALRAYRAVVEAAPGTELAFDARKAMVQLLRDRLNDPAAAAGELSALLEAFPDHQENALLRLEYARLAFRAGKMRSAIQHSQKLLEIPDKAIRQEAALLLASIHRLEGRRGDALALYEGLLAGNLDAKTEAQIRLEAGHCLEALGRFQEAIAAYEGATGAIDRDIVAARVTRVKARLEGNRGQKNGRSGPSSIRN